MNKKEEIITDLISSFFDFTFFEKSFYDKIITLCKMP